MIDLKNVPCLHEYFKGEAVVDQQDAYARAAANGLAQAAAPAYPSKSLALQNGQYRVTDSEK